MAQVTGIVKIWVDGTLHRSKEGAKLTFGGKERTLQVGHSVYGYSEKVVPSQVEFTIAHTSEKGLVDKLRNATDATVRFETDVGLTYLCTGMVVTASPELTGGEGDLTITMMGNEAIEEA